MKKILGIILILMLIAVPVQARKQVITTQLKLQSNNRAINNYTLKSGIDHYTQPVSVHDSQKTGALLISNEGGSAFDIDVEYEISDDGVNFFKPLLLSGVVSGSYSTDETIALAVNANRYIEFTHQMARFIRFNFDPDAYSEVTIIYIQQVGD